MHFLRTSALVLFFAGALDAQPPVYHVTDLGAVTGTRSAATGISQNGTYVVGTFQTPGTQPNQAFLYSAANGAAAIGTLGGVSIPSAVNNSGQVAGYSVPSNDHAFLYSNGTMNDLGTIGGGVSGSFGYGLNNQGQVVGYSNVSAANTHQYDAFLYTSSMQDLGLPAGSTNSYAMGITDTGVIVGYFTPDGATTHPFQLSGGQFTDLGTLNGTASGTFGSAAAISANGLIVGSSNTSAGQTHAFLYSGGQMKDLGTLAGATSRAAGVNSNGDVVGYGTWAGSGFHGFLYHAGTLLDLNLLLDVASTGYVISQAAGISEGGAIAVVGNTPGGATHALLLTPVTAGSPQSITFDAIPNQILGGAPFAVAAEASSELPVTIASTTPAVCKNASNVVMLLTAGTCSLNATQAGNASFSAATPVTRTFTVTAAGISGTLQATAGSPFATGTQPRGLAVGDFNGDGFADLAVANYSDNNVAVLLGNGSGGFAAATHSPFALGAATSPQAVAAGDFNADGFLDLAVADSGSNQVTVLLGDGAGGFTPLAGGPITVGLQPTSLAVGDFNGDGVQDLAVTNYSSGTVSILAGNGAGGFTAATGSPYLTGTNPISVAVGDFNGDGFQDLAIANYGSSNVTVLMGNSLGVLTPAVGSPFGAGSNPYWVTAADVNADGALDLAIANSGSGNVTVLIGSGSGGFAPAANSPFSAGTNPYAVAAADFDGDGFVDLAVANYGSNNLTMLLGNGAGAFTAAAGGPIPGLSAPFALAVADFNHDGIQDLAATNYGAGNAAILLGGKDATTSQLTTSSQLTIVQGQTVPLTLTVGESTTPFHLLTGTATFLDGATSLGAASQSTSPFSFTTPALTAGSHALSAAYSGDARNTGSTSNTLTIQVLSACDLNKDGSTDIRDVQLGINEVLGIAASGDLDASGAFTVVDNQIVLDAAAGLACLATIN